MHLQSASQSFGTDSRFRVMSGKTCAVIASCGSPAIFNSLVWVDVISDSLAQITLMGSCFNAFPGQLLLKKCPVAPESGWASTGLGSDGGIRLLFLTTVAYDTLVRIILGESLLLVIEFFLVILVIHLFSFCSAFSPHLHFL